MKGRLLYFFILLLLSLQYGDAKLIYLSSEAEYSERNQYEYLNPNLLLSATQRQTSCSVLNLKSLNPAIEIARSGYLRVSEYSNSVLAFTFYGAQKAKSIEELKNFPIIIWLQGGPGSSSQFGSFNEIGPIKFSKENNNFEKSNISWNQDYSLLFVDQPIGTGLSFSESYEEIPIDQDQVSLHFMHALNQLFYNEEGCFNMMQLFDAPLFIFGESYAGKYIPAIAQRILLDGNKINLRGVGIGDGFTDPLKIILKYPDFLYKTGRIDEKVLNQLRILVEKFKYAYQQNNKRDLQDIFERILQTCKRNAQIEDVYNIFNQESINEWENRFNRLISSREFYKLFKFDESIKFQAQNTMIYKRFQEKDFFLNDCVERLEFILDMELPVLIFQGQLDLIVCEDCTLNWLKDLNFANKNLIKKENIIVWKSEGKELGIQIDAYPLQYRLIEGAGHMVPMDQPQAALLMLNDFIKKSLQSK